MEDEKIDSMLKSIMKDSLLEPDDHQIDNKLMEKILAEHENLKNRREVLSRIFIFTGITFFLFALILVLIFLLPGAYFLNIATGILKLFHSIGTLFIEYDYLVISFLFVGLLDILINRDKRLKFIFHQTR